MADGDDVQRLLDLLERELKRVQAETGLVWVDRRVGECLVVTVPGKDEATLTIRVQEGDVSGG